MIGYIIILEVITLIVYLDVVFIENFFIDLFLLYSISHILNVKLYKRWAILSSAIASLYILTMFSSKLKFLSMFPFNVLITMAFIVIAFRRYDREFILKASLLYLLYAFILAGLDLFFSIRGCINDINYEFQFKNLVFAILIIYIFMKRIVSYVKDRRVMNNFIYNVEILYEGYPKKVRAFLDTGNELREPATNLPVIIVERKIFEDDVDFEKEIFYIPYKAINGHRGNLKGFKPSEVRIQYSENEIRNIEVIVCLSDETLSESNEFEALLSRGIL